MLNSVSHHMIETLTQADRVDHQSLLAGFFCEHLINDVPPPRISVEKRSQESKGQPDALLIRQDSKSFLDGLSQIGFVTIGQGDDAFALARPDDDWVVRIGQNPEPQDRFMAIAMTSINPHLPRVWYHRSQDGVSISLMERLQETDNTQALVWEPVNQAASLAYAINDGRISSATVDNSLTSELLEVAQILGSVARENDYALDLNRNNIMSRGADNVFVFIDPWCPWGD